MRPTALATAAFVFLFVLTPYPSFAASKIEISGWIPYWRAATGTADTLQHLDQLTEVNPFGYSVNSDGTLADTAHILQEPWVSFIAVAKQKKVRVIPTVMWSDGAAIHRILSNQKTRVALEDEIAAAVKQNNFDGIDIDFEGKYAETKNYFSIFLKGLYARMGKKWVMCTIEARTPVSSRYETPPDPKTILYANDFVAINKYCDRVRFMTYDQGTIDVTLNKARLAPYIPVADPAWVEKTIRLAMQTIARKKIMIGVATYGYEYEYVPLSQSGYRYDLQWALNPKYATDLAAQLGITPIRNGANEISFTYVPALQSGAATTSAETSAIPLGLATTAPAAVALATLPQNIVWWSDAVAIKDKVDLAKRLGVSGVSIFKLDGGEDPKLWDVLK